MNQAISWIRAEWKRSATYWCIIVAQSVVIIVLCFLLPSPEPERYIWGDPRKMATLGTLEGCVDYISTLPAAQPYDELDLLHLKSMQNLTELFIKIYEP